MTQREKMLRGELYDANFDPAFLAERQQADSLCYDYNALRPDDPRRQEILKALLGQVPEGLTLLSPVYFDYGSLTRFGKGVFVNHGCYFMDGGTITIGDNVFIGPFTGFYTAAHPVDYRRRNQGLEWAKPIRVGDNCWFGANVSVMPGVTIGSGCVIAAGSVVTRDLPDNSLAAGVPAEVKKTICQEETIGDV